MREICTSGSVRGEGGNILTYSAVLSLEGREVGGKGRWVTQAVEIAEERQPARRVGVGERLQEEPPEQAGKHPHWQEEPGLAAHPVRAVERYPAPWHNHMDVRVVGHRRAPAMEHSAAI